MEANITEISLKLKITAIEIIGSIKYDIIETFIAHKVLLDEK